MADLRYNINRNSESDVINLMKKYDVIIIGAGLAGCVLGFLLKRQNKQVLTVEQKDIKKKSKLCGGIITSKAYTLLEDIYKEKITSLNFIEYDECKIINNNKKISLNKKIYTIDRKELDDFVLNEYLNLKGDLIDRINNFRIDNDMNKIIIEDKEFGFDYLVAADGALSQVRKILTNRSQKLNFALESNIQNYKYKDLEIHFSNNLKGYCWKIPNANYNLAGIGDVSGRTKIQIDFDKFIEQENISIDNTKGAFLANGNDIYLEFNQNIKFIGDAAGLTSPITGEGIYYALASAKILSDNFDNYKSNMNKILKQLRKENFYKKFVFNSKIRNHIFNQSEKKIYKNIVSIFVKKML